MRWLLQNGFTFIGKKVIKGKEYLYARKGKVFRSAGPYSVAEPYFRSLTSRKEPEPAATRGAAEIAAAARREYEQLEDDAIADPSRLKYFILQLVPRKDSDFWRQFNLLAGSEGLMVLDAESVVLSFIERVRTAEANKGPTPDFYAHVVEKMKEWVESAIVKKRGSLAPLGTASSKCHVCHSTMEAHPVENTDFRVYRIRCGLCAEYRTWPCSICNETLICLKVDKQPLHLRCPRCGYGLGFETPIELNSPQTNEGWNLLGHITTWSPGALDRTPYRVLQVVSHYEKNQEGFRKIPEALAENLRDIGVAARSADTIATLQLHKVVRTTKGVIGYECSS